MDIIKNWWKEIDMGKGHSAELPIEVVINFMIKKRLAPDK